MLLIWGPLALINPSITLVGTYSQCLSEWENPLRAWLGFSWGWKYSYQRAKERANFLSSMTKQPLANEIYINGGGWKNGTFLTTPQNLADTSSSTIIMGYPLKWTSGKSTFRGTTSCNGHMFEILTGTGRKLPLCGPFGTRHLWSISASSSHHTCFYF